MMRRSIVLLMVVLCLGASSAKANLTLDDGGTHNIDYYVFPDISVLDGPGPTPTTLNLLSGSEIEKDVRVFDTSIVNVYDGLINLDLRARNHSFANVYGGLIGGKLLSWGHSIVNVYGGEMQRLETYYHSVVNVYGAGFNYPYGPITDISGTLTGTLISGESINWNFERFGASSIYLIPAPGALVLGSLGVGLVSWLRRRRML